MDKSNNEQTNVATAGDANRTPEYPINGDPADATINMEDDYLGESSDLMQQQHLAMTAATAQDGDAAQSGTVAEKDSDGAPSLSFSATVPLCAASPSCAVAAVIAKCCCCIRSELSPR